MKDERNKPVNGDGEGWHKTVSMEAIWLAEIGMFLPYDFRAGYNRLVPAEFGMLV